jgi:hypothetical protein
MPRQHRATDRWARFSALDIKLALLPAQLPGADTSIARPRPTDQSASPESLEARRLATCD